MKIMIRLGMLFYSAVTLFVIFTLFIFVFNLLPYDYLMDLLSFMYFDTIARIFFAFVALVFLLTNHIFWGAISGIQQKGKTIAFDNPSGRVTVSLTAMEDLIRRVISRVPEVKEVRSSITAGKKGLEIIARLVLNTDVNIPEMTSNLQELVKRKIQDTIGIEETIIVKVDVVKIIPSAKSRHQKSQEEPKEEIDSHVPFQGYRA